MRTLPFQAAEDVRAVIPQVVEHLRAGGLIAYPTETVYGFGCLLQDHALERLAEVKGRGDDKPFLLLMGTEQDLKGVSWPESARRLAEVFWPGPLTLALPAETGRFHPRVVGAGGTVAVRRTPQPAIRELLLVLHEPITSTSANAPGEASALTAEDAATVLQRAGATNALVLDGGALAPSKPSTLVDCSVEPPRLIREGVLTRGDLAKIVSVDG